MPSKRDILAELTRDELITIVDQFELTPASRRKKDDLLEAVAGSKKATLGDILPALPRERLKALCQALELDDSGRDKATLVDRLMATKGNRDDSVRPTANKRGNGSDSVPPTTNRKSQQPDARAAKGRDAGESSESLEPGQLLTREKLESYLWSAADILRGSIDSSDYKNYILGLLFLKRLSDRFEEECEALANEAGADPEDPDEHDFFCAPAHTLGCNPESGHQHR